MRANFDHALAWVQEDEGGGATRPDEPGGAVFHGVSLTAYRQYCERHGRPVPSIDDLMHLSMDDERTIYREDYADKVDFDDMPWPVDYVMFNAAVMSGVTAAKMMYVKAANGEIPHVIAAGIIVLQMQKMMQKPNVGKFGTGWSNRMVRVWNRSFLNGVVV